MGPYGRQRIRGDYRLWDRPHEPLGVVKVNLPLGRGFFPADKLRLQSTTALDLSVRAAALSTIRTLTP